MGLLSVETHIKKKYFYPFKKIYFTYAWGTLLHQLGPKSQSMHQKGLINHACETNWPKIALNYFAKCSHEFEIVLYGRFMCDCKIELESKCHSKAYSGKNL